MEKHEEKIKMTVFTPTYNRGYIIQQLYESLLRQTSKNFEWLVIDDGSTDQTEKLFESWQAKSDFPIRYYKKENGGKHRAINHGLDLAAGELFFTVDSDDYLTDDAIEKVIEWENRLEEKERYACIMGNCGLSRDDTPNTIFNKEFFDTTLLSRYPNNEFHLDGERAIVFYTNVHRKFKYPEIPGEKFMTEAVVWNRIANAGYQARAYNNIIWIYEYRNDGLTTQGNRLFIENPRGYGIWLKEKALFSKGSFKEQLTLYYSFGCELLPYYSIEEIAKFIDCPKPLMQLLMGLHKSLKFSRRFQHDKSN